MEHPRNPTFCSLSNVHKNNIDPPGHPIISGNGSIAENVCCLIDEHLRPYVDSLPSCVKDTIHFLKILDGLYIPAHVTLLTIDVEALFHPSLLGPGGHSLYSVTADG